MIPIARAIHDAVYEKICAVMGSQMSKTETIVNVMGHRLDDKPVPLLYVAPTRTFVESVFEPRFKAMITQSKSLAMKKRPGKREKKTTKHIAGVKARFAWAGSATEMSGDPACKVFVDERDRMVDNVAGEGDPVELADARHATYPDGQTIIMSTPTEGTVETEAIEGLEFWKITEQDEENSAEIVSATWKIFQEGTMRHWAVPCPECGDFFIPRFKQLWWPHDKEGHSCSPAEARREARLICFSNGCVIDPKHKEEMHQQGVYVAPGQTIDPDGTLRGSVPESSTDSYWVSGLMSPWMTWGELAERWLKAVRSGDPERIQGVINTKFGELYSVAGDAPSEDVVKNLRMPYPLGSVPAGVLKIFMGVDVQKDRLFYSIRGFGVEMQSWHMGHGELLGNTDEDDVWADLSKFRDKMFGGIPISKCNVDSGYRTQFVYKFCRKHRGWAFSTKGRDTIESAPLTHSKLDTTESGKRFGLGIWHLNTDYFKRWIHERIERDPTLPGGFHLAEDTTDDYCLQLISEARVVKPSGKVVWIQIRKDNHYLDCEVNVLAAAYSSNMQAYTQEWYAKEQAKQESKRKAPRRSEGGKDAFRSSEERRGGNYNSWFNK